LIYARDVLTEDEWLTIRAMRPQSFEVVETKGKRAGKSIGAFVFYRFRNRTGQSGKSGP
jgi:hypothetical protein